MIPVEFVNAPAGAVLDQQFITDLVTAHACPDCQPVWYRFRYQPEPGQPPEDRAAWRVDTFHGRGCPGAWLAERRFAGADETPDVLG